MASITIRNLDDNVKQKLRKQAAENGRSLEAEVRDILSRNANESPSSHPIKTGLDLFRGIREAVENMAASILSRFQMRFLPSNRRSFGTSHANDNPRYQCCV